MAHTEGRSFDFTLLYPARVLRNDDPEKLGRVRGLIPGLSDKGEGTNWAIPVGLPGCGPTRGTFSAPPLESNVIMGFLMGDVKQPFYMGGIIALGELPTEVQKQTPPDVHKVHAFESDTFEVFINEVEKKLVFRTKDKNQEIEIDAVDQSISLKATNWLILKAGAISIEAGKMQCGVPGAQRCILPIGMPI